MVASHHVSNGMPTSTRLLIGAIGLTVLCLLSPAHAQQVESADQAELHQASTKKRIGDTTNNILQAQANGSMAGSHLPILGPTATLSWQRYLESYKYPIPETFTRKLDEIGQR